MARIRSIKPDFWTDEKVQSNCTNSYCIYLISENESKLIAPCKIGIATNLNKRLSSLQGGNHRTLYLHYKFTFKNRSDAFETEQYVLLSLRSKRLMSEWMDYSCTELADHIINFVNADKEILKETING